MLTPLTVTAIAILHHISGIRMISASECPLSPTDLSALLSKLESGGLIRHLAEHPSGVLASYELTSRNYDITLLQILEAIDEHLNCNEDIRNEMYERCREAAIKLGIINQITRKYLSEINLTDF